MRVTSHVRQNHITILDTITAKSLAHVCVVDGKRKGIILGFCLGTCGARLATQSFPGHPLSLFILEVLVI